MRAALGGAGNGGVTMAEERVEDRATARAADEPQVKPVKRQVRQ